MEDDIYNGMRIPKGAIVIPNTRYLNLLPIVHCLVDRGPHRSFTWEASKFREAKLFIPERYLPKPEGFGEVLPANLFWGWGRR